MNGIRRSSHDELRRTVVVYHVQEWDRRLATYCIRTSEKEWKELVVTVGYELSTQDVHRRTLGWHVAMLYVCLYVYMSQYVCHDLLARMASICQAMHHGGNSAGTHKGTQWIAYIHYFESTTKLTDTFLWLPAQQSPCEESVRLWYLTFSCKDFLHCRIHTNFKKSTTRWIIVATCPLFDPSLSLTLKPYNQEGALHVWNVCMSVDRHVVSNSKLYPSLHAWTWLLRSCTFLLVSLQSRQIARSAC